MKLRHSHTSPYVRKVMMVAIECGLDGAIESEPTDAWSPATDLPSINPLGKVPTLLLDDGTALFDSPVICEYLDSLHAGAKLFPAPGAARWTALRQQAMGDGICDAAVGRRLEQNRPDGERSQRWVDRYGAAVLRTVDALEADAAALPAQPTIGTFALLAALGYLDFRWPEAAWREGRPALAAWYARESQRPSFLRTAPPA